MTPTIKLTLDAEPAMQALSQLRDLFTSQAIKQAFKVVFQGPYRATDFFRCDHRPALGTTVRLVLNPTQRLLDFIATHGAGKLDGHISE
jgi:hypothetical protein